MNTGEWYHKTRDGDYVRLKNVEVAEIVKLKQKEVRAILDE